jgi:hypothetical protein
MSARRVGKGGGIASPNGADSRKPLPTTLVQPALFQIAGSASLGNAHESTFVFNACASAFAHPTTPSLNGGHHAA